MGTMTEQQWRVFVLSGSRTAKVATVSEDSHPLVVPVWFDLEGEELVFETGGSSKKARNIEVNPNVSICVDDERFPFAFVSLRGRARLERLSPEQLLPWTTRLSRRYVGDDRAAEYGKRNAVEGGVLVRVEIDHVFTMDDVAA